MKNSDYWKQRFEIIEAAKIKTGEHTITDIERMFKTANRELESIIHVWYGRFADNNQITLAEAKRLLKTNELAELKWDVKEYIKYGEQAGLNPAWIKQLENASARFHVSRLEALQLQAQQTMEKLFGNQLDAVDALMRKQYLEGYYHAFYEIQKGFNIGWDIAAVNDGKLEKIISKPWTTDKRTFSDRIWTDKSRLLNEVHTQLAQNMILGKSPDAAIKNLTKAMNTTKNNAGRLIMTESAYFSNLAQRDVFNELDIERFEIVATLDSHTSEICRQMDGKVFAMADFEPGVTAPPFHPWCRTTNVPYFDDDIGERAARDAETGKTYYVPSDMKYDEWRKSYVDKTQPPRTTSNISLKTDEQRDRIVYDIENSTKKLKQVMNDSDYAKYLERLNNHTNPFVQKLYTHADEITDIKLSNGGAYNYHSNSINFSYVDGRYVQNGIDKYSTLAHEYGHFFASKCSYENLTFTEMDAIHKHVSYSKILFRRTACTSDEFLKAVREDKQHLKKVLTNEIKNELATHDASGGVQDAIDGLLGERIRWGHGDKYYSRKYANVKQCKDQKNLQDAYKELGFDVSNQGKVSSLCRNYEAASEIWANVMEAETNGGESLAYVKKYLPNSYASLLEILKGVQ